MSTHETLDKEDKERRTKYEWKYWENKGISLIYGGNCLKEVNVWYHQNGW